MGQRDMLLELSVLSYHRLSPKQVAVKRFDAHGGSLGRSERADWYLPDPERVVSGIHAELRYQNGHYHITDKSTNGLFINRSVEALGQDNSYTLKHGDILCMGDYEIQAALISALPADDNVTASNSHQSAANYSADRFEPSPAAMTGLTLSSLTAQNSDSAVTSTDHNLPLDDHFLPPSALIPDDWGSQWQSNEHNQAVEEVTTLIESSTAAIATPPAAQALDSLIPPAPANNVSHHAKRHNPPAAGQACLQAFLNGLGVSEANIQQADSEAWWEQLGQALQQSLLGMIDVMRARSEVKSSFRVNQTTFQQRENNPLKFSANIDDAFHNLFNRPGSSFLPANQAIKEAFADISRHEDAIIAGASSAINGVLTQLAPHQIEQKDYSSNFLDKLNPAQRQARMWSLYKALHQDLAVELNKNKQRGVNDDFISAYEAHLRSQGQ